MKETEKAYLHQYLLYTRDFWSHYRAQKETAAWLAATVYLGGLFAIDSFVVQNSWSGFYKLLLIDAISLLVLITGFLTWGFMNSQNNNRKFASNILNACNDVLAQLLSNELPSESLVQKEFHEGGQDWWFPNALILRYRVRCNDFIEQPFSWELDAIYCGMVVWTLASLILLIFVSV